MLAIAVLTFLLARPAAGGASQAAQISAISPTVADRGGVVTIDGWGFGGRNVTIMVGGEPAEVLSATGSRATFRVPALAGPGEVTVQATNPGGPAGTIDLFVRFDGHFVQHLDEPAAVSALVGRAGGLLTAGGVALVIPPGALLDDQLITMTPLVSLHGSPVDQTLIGGVHFEPSGLFFLRPAQLTMLLPAAVPAADVVGFVAPAADSDLHLVPAAVEGGLITLDIWHFSSAGAAGGGAGAAAAMQGYTPSTAEQQALQRIAAAIPACQAELAQGTVDGPACTHRRQEAIRAFFEWYVNAVQPGLQQALGAPSFQVEPAMVEWFRWNGEVETLFAEDGPGLGCGTLQAECNQARQLATAAIADLARRRLQNCTGTTLASQIRDVIRVTDFAVGIDLTTADPPLPDAGGLGLVKACASIRIEAPPDFPRVAARSRANHLAVRAYIGTYTGARLTNVPLVLSLAVAPGTADTSSGPLDAQGRFETNVYPSGQSNVTIDITVELAPTALPEIPATDALSVAVRESFATTLTPPLHRAVRDRVELDALGSTTINPGGAAPLTIKVAGDGLDGAHVTYTLSGPGSLSTTAGTTNADGVAPTFDYIAPPAGSPGNSATITATFGDASDSVTITVTAPVQITISPAAASLNPGGTAQFTATVTGTTNTAVTWSATGGGISQSGLYTAGSTTGSFTVTATSVADPTVSGSATVTVIGASLFLRGRHEGVVGTVVDGVIREHAPGGLMNLVFERSGDRMTIGYYRCVRQAGAPTSFVCILEAVFETVLSGLTFTGPGVTVAGNLSGLPGGQSTGDIAGTFSPDGRIMSGRMPVGGVSLDFVADRVGQKQFAGPMEGTPRYQGGRIEPWRYAYFEIEGQITDLRATRPFDPRFDEVTVSAPSGRSLACDTGDRDFLAQFLVGQSVIMYCRHSTHPMPSSPTSLIHLFRFP